jgi:hypothetical protein
MYRYISFLGSLYFGSFRWSLDSLIRLDGDIEGDHLVQPIDSPEHDGIPGRHPREHELKLAEGKGEGQGRAQLLVKELDYKGVSLEEGCQSGLGPEGEYFAQCYFGGAGVEGRQGEDCLCVLEGQLEQGPGEGHSGSQGVQGGLEADCWHNINSEGLVPPLYLEVVVEAGLAGLRGADAVQQRGLGTRAPPAPLVEERGAGRQERGGGGLRGRRGQGPGPLRTVQLLVEHLEPEFWVPPIILCGRPLLFGAGLRMHLPGIVLLPSGEEQAVGTHRVQVLPLFV